MLIKNYNLGSFIQDIECQVQQILLESMKRHDSNVFTAYLVDFTWKIVQVKIACMVRQLNFKITTDARAVDQRHDMEKKKMRAEHEREMEDLNKEIEQLKVKIDAQQTQLTSYTRELENKSSIIRQQREELAQLRSPQGYSHFMHTIG